MAEPKLPTIRYLRPASSDSRGRVSIAHEDVERDREPLEPEEQRHQVRRLRRRRSSRRRRRRAARSTRRRGRAPLAPTRRRRRRRPAAARISWAKAPQLVAGHRVREQRRRAAGVLVEDDARRARAAVANPAKATSAATARRHPGRDEHGGEQRDRRGRERARARARARTSRRCGVAIDGAASAAQRRGCCRSSVGNEWLADRGRPDREHEQAARRAGRRCASSPGRRSSARRVTAAVRAARAARPRSAAACTSRRARSPTAPTAA